MVSTTLSHHVSTDRVPSPAQVDSALLYILHMQISTHPLSKFPEKILPRRLLWFLRMTPLAGLTDCNGHCSLLIGRNTNPRVLIGWSVFWEIYIRTEVIERFSWSRSDSLQRRRVRGLFIRRLILAQLNNQFYTHKEAYIYSRLLHLNSAKKGSLFRRFWPQFVNPTDHSDFL